jgi:hypothetical protein
MPFDSPIGHLSTNLTNATWSLRCSSGRKNDARRVAASPNQPRAQEEVRVLEENQAIRRQPPARAAGAARRIIARKHRACFSTSALASGVACPHGPHPPV